MAAFNCLRYLVIWNTRSTVKNQRNIKMLADSSRTPPLNVRCAVVDAEYQRQLREMQQGEQQTPQPGLIAKASLNSWAVVPFAANFAASTGRLIDQQTWAGDAVSAILSPNGT